MSNIMGNHYPTAGLGLAVTCLTRQKLSIMTILSLDFGIISGFRLYVYT